MKRSVVALLAVGFASSCMDLDGFVWNPRHCSGVDKTSTDCTVKNVCSACEEPYPFEENGIPQASVTQVTIPVSGDRTLDSYFISSSGERPNDVIVYAHGNFGGIEHYLNRVALLYKLGVNLFVLDYQGFGKSKTANEPDEATFMTDANESRAVLDGILEERGLVGARIIVYGFSGGVLSAVEIAKNRAPCGLILEAAFPSVQSFTDDSTFAQVPQSFITRGAWDNISKMPDVHAPLFQLHGAEDDFVRVEVGRQVFAAANEPKEFVEVKGAGHGNAEGDVPDVLGPLYPTLLAGFMDGLECQN